MEPSIAKKCSFCPTEKSQYRCPRCGLFYCSVKCYQHADHLLCSESFYKSWIEASAAELGTEDNESKRKMYDILKRVNDMEEISQELDSDDDLEQNLEENCASILENKLNELNLTNIDSNTDFDQLWGSLTPEEQEKIKKEMERENVAQFIETWTPWWEIPVEKKKLVEEINSKTSDEELIKSKLEAKVPLIPKTISNFDEITTKPPSPSLVFNMINILGSYVYVARRYNGDYANEIQESVPLLYKMSGVLSANKNYETLELALFGIKDEDLTTFSINLGREELVLIMHDVCKILEASSDKVNYSLSALSDIIDLFKALKVMLKQKKTSLPSSLIQDLGLNVKVVNLIVRKLEYFSSWNLSKYVKTKNLPKYVPEIQLMIANIVEDDISFKTTAAEQVKTLTIGENYSPDSECAKTRPNMLVEEL